MTKPFSKGDEYWTFILHVQHFTSISYAFANLSEKLTWVNPVKGHVCLDSLVFSQVNYFCKYLALYRKILFLLVCCLSLCNFSTPAHSALPFLCSPLGHFWLCEFQKCKSLVTLIQLYLYYYFSPNYHDHPVRSGRVVGQWVQRRQLPLGRLMLLPLVLYPGLLPFFCVPLYHALQSWPLVVLTEQFRYLGNWEWADSWSEQPPYLPWAVLSSAVHQSSC